MAKAFRAILLFMPTFSKYAEEGDQNKEQHYFYVIFFFAYLLCLYCKISLFIAKIGHHNVLFCKPIKITELTLW